MRKTLRRIASAALLPFPNAKNHISRSLRRWRMHNLRSKYPNGGYLKCNGADVYCDFTNENFAWYDGDSEYLQYELDVFTSLFVERPPSIILDVGAHWGFYSAYLGNSRYADAITKIVSVEADPENASVLSKTLAKVTRVPVSQVNAAMSDKDGYLEIFSGGGTCKQCYQAPDAKSFGKVQALSLNSLVQTQLSAGELVTHVKLDIDGYEPAFFEGGQEVLARFRPIIMMEFWAKGLMASGVDLDKYWAMLHQNYIVQEASFVSRRLKHLNPNDLSQLIERTMNVVTNLVLRPK